MSALILLQVEQAYERNVLLAVELLDAVTLERISTGVKVVAEGLQAKPILNPSCCFVWLKEGNAAAQKITVDPRPLPFETAERDASQITLPLTTIELQPRVSYEFAPGVTGLRGTLIEERIPNPVPVGEAEIKLRWLDDSGSWQDAPTASHTDTKSGDFVSFLRLAPKEKPDIDANGAVTVRLQVRRNGSTRSSTDLKLLQGRITDPTTLNSLTFAWDELLP
jgi:hypothetical protein